MAERTPLNLNDRIPRLLQLIEDDGMDKVYQRSDLSRVDRGILSLLTGFTTLKGARELSEILRTQDPPQPDRKPFKHAIRGADLTAMSVEKPSSSPSSSKPTSPRSAGEGEGRS